MRFDKVYTQYWEKAVEKSVDGTVIAGPKEVSRILDLCNIKKIKNALDLGCSTGRMCSVLSGIAENVYGVDPDDYAIGKAILKPYAAVTKGTGEKTGHAREFFDFIFCWATFEVISHLEGLLEANRILKKQGKLLFTGKSADYCSDDALAFKAEKNAFLKGFPNRFSNLRAMHEQLPLLGYKVTDFISYARRGDLGEMKYQRHKNLSDFLARGICCYEYLMVVEKIESRDDGLTPEREVLDVEFSNTALQISSSSGFSCSTDYFNSIGLD